MSKRNLVFHVAALTILFLSFRPVQPQEAFTLPRLAEPIKLDGQIDETAWQNLPPLELTMYQPTFQGAPTERTEIRVAYDDYHLYFAGRFYDSDPAAVRANSLYRDRYSGDDTFGIILDVFNDNENGLWFWVTPAGVRGDETIANDAEGAINNSWNTYWDAAAIQTEAGWFAEVRIPFSSLGFQDDGGRIVMGMTVYRLIARKNERLTFPAISSNWNFIKPSKAKRVILDGIISQKPVYVTPYALGGFGQTSLLDHAETAYRLNNEPANELGLDLKYNLNSNLTLDATLNTDFAQVEADDQQVNLSRFSLFFPEKRQFFQERANIFAFNTLVFGSDRLFHSRRIGLHEGRAVRILGGARLVGRAGQWDVGLIDMQTARSDALPSENFGVLRLRRQVFNPYSYTGGMITSRLGEGGRYNVAYGLDGIFRLVGDEYLTLKWAQTFDDDLIRNNGFDFGRAGLFQAQWQRRRQQGFNYFTSLTSSGPDYRPEMGFATRQNFTEAVWLLRYDSYRGERSAFRRISPLQLFGFVALRNEDRTAESALVEYDLDFEWKSGAELGMDFEWYYEDLHEPLSFPDDAAVPAGRYKFYGIATSFDMAEGQLLRSEFDLGLGKFYDGWRLDLGVSPRWNVSRFLELSGEYELHFIRFLERDQGFEAHVFRLRTQAALNTKVSLSAFMQYNSAAERLSTNARFRYNFREGNDLWMVYNEGLNLDRGRATPILPRTSDRTVLVKYTYAFHL